MGEKTSFAKQIKTMPRDTYSRFVKGRIEKEETNIFNSFRSIFDIKDSDDEKISFDLGEWEEDIELYADDVSMTIKERFGTGITCLPAWTSKQDYTISNSMRIYTGNAAEEIVLNKDNTSLYVIYRYPREIFNTLMKRLHYKASCCYVDGYITAYKFTNRELETEVVYRPSSNKYTIAKGGHSFKVPAMRCTTVEEYDEESNRILVTFLGAQNYAIFSNDKTEVSFGGRK